LKELYTLKIANQSRLCKKTFCILYLKLSKIADTL
jgi:hypothetical protein